MPAATAALSRPRLLAALLTGGALPLAFAPFGWHPVAVLSLAALWWLWEDESPRAAKWIGFAWGVGAFLAGTVFAMVFRHRGQLEQKLKGFSYGFLIPIFFINVGIHFDVDALGEPGAITGMLVLVGAAVAVKVFPALVLDLTQAPVEHWPLTSTNTPLTMPPGRLEASRTGAPRTEFSE